MPTTCHISASLADCCMGLTHALLVSALLTAHSAKVTIQSRTHNPMSLAPRDLSPWTQILLRTGTSMAEPRQRFSSASSLITQASSPAGPAVGVGAVRRGAAWHADGRLLAWHRPVAHHGRGAAAQDGPGALFIHDLLNVFHNCCRPGCAVLLPGHASLMCIGPQADRVRGATKLSSKFMLDPVHVRCHRLGTRLCATWAR